MLKALVRRTLCAIIACTIPLAALADNSAVANINIAAGTLYEALQQLASQTGAQLIYAPEQLKGYSTGSVRGSLTVDAAVKKLLQGTNLVVTEHPSGAFLIGPAHEHEAASLPRRMLLASANEAKASDVSQSKPEPSEGLREIVITATRQEQSLSKVPLSVQALTQEVLEATGVKEFADVIRLSPGLTLNDTFAGGTNIAIRGIGSSAGSATTGVYLDDVPIQVRNLGYSATTLFPRIFDLDRLEVLRGPQGTLFGAGSEGGTVRFILPKPSLDTYDSFTRAEIATTHSGAPSYEVGEAMGGPLISGVLGVRFSAYYRHDGGWIDRITGSNFTIVKPDGSLYGPSATLSIAATPYRNSNYSDAEAFRLALRLAPMEGVSIQPAFMYQKQRVHDDLSTFWLASSDPRHSRFAAPLFQQIPGYLNPTGAPNLNSGDNELYLPSIEAEWHGPGLSAYATTSYLMTRKAQWVDSTTGYLQAYNNTVFPPPGYKAPDHNVDRDDVFTQELRLQSDDNGGRLNWLVGAFYSHARQYSQEDIHPNFFDSFPSYFGIPNLDNGPPFGPGSTNFQNIWGAPLLPDSTSYLAAFTSIDKQIAGFGQISYRPLDTLTLTAGVRVSRNTFHFGANFAGPENNLNAPFGAPCPTGLTCVFNDPNGYWGPQYPVGTADTAESAVTPKYTVSYQPNSSNLLYATISKGFRPGGGELSLPTVCDAQLVQLGYVDSNGNAKSPLTYKSDSVWNYEIGSKNQLLDNRIVFDANAYVIKWKGVQTQIIVPVCGYGLTDNFGNATSKGVDLAVQIRPMEHLTLGINASYNQATFDTNIGNPSGSIIIFRKGETLPEAGSPWNASLQTDYRHKILQQPFYLHADFTYTGRPRRTGNLEPGTVNYQPLLLLDPAVKQVNVRLGTELGPVDVSIFADNLFDASPLLGLSQPRDPNQIGSASIWTAGTIRPRTFGVTLAMRF